VEAEVGIERDRSSQENQAPIRFVGVLTLSVTPALSRFARSDSPIGRSALRANPTQYDSVRCLPEGELWDRHGANWTYRDDSFPGQQIRLNPYATARRN
jgi:hypothetical protein